MTLKNPRILGRDEAIIAGTYYRTARPGYVCGPWTRCSVGAYGLNVGDEIDMWRRAQNRRAEYAVETTATATQNTPTLVAHQEKRYRALRDDDLMEYRKGIETFNPLTAAWSCVGASWFGAFGGCTFREYYSALQARGHVVKKEEW
jgi:hypothetical protein